MKKTATVILFALLSGAYGPLQAQSPVPVIDRNGTSTQPLKAVATTQSQGAIQRPTTAQPSANAELLMMVSQLQEEVRYLRGQLEEMAHRLKNMRENQRDRYRDLDRRITRINQELAQQGSQPPVPAPLPERTPATTASEQTSDEAPQAAAAATVAPESVGGVSDRQAYQKAFSLVRQREFDKALSAFKRFIIDYPQSSLVANVLYWTGEVYRAKPEPDNERAREAYTQLVSQYPDHQKAADAYYKLGLTYQAQGDMDKAREMMNKVISLYPDQSAARLAGDYLKKNR